MIKIVPEFFLTQEYNILIGQTLCFRIINNCIYLCFESCDIDRLLADMELDRQKYAYISDRNFVKRLLKYNIINEEEYLQILLLL